MSLLLYCENRFEMDEKYLNGMKMKVFSTVADDILWIRQMMSCLFGIRLIM